jgi:hypothetical protein
MKNLKVKSANGPQFSANSSGIRDRNRLPYSWLRKWRNAPYLQAQLQTMAIGTQLKQHP